MITRKPIDLSKLEGELRAGGIQVAAIGRNGDDLHTYDANGTPVDLPPAARAVVDAHVPPPELVPPDYGDDDDADRTGNQLAQAVSNLRQFVATPSPTQAQVVTALKLTIRLVLLLARRSLRAPSGG